MKKIIGAMFALVLGSAALAGTASASPIGLDGPYAVTITPSDPTVFDPLHIGATVVGLSLGLSENVDYVGRLSDGAVVFNPLQPGLAGASLTGTGLTGTSGTWTFVSGADVYEIVAVEIDAGNFQGIGAGALYLTDPVANSGFWDTSDLGTLRFQPNLNYLDFYGVKISGDVPEPMSLMLLGGGLAGFGFVRRKKRS